MTTPAVVSLRAAQRVNGAAGRNAGTANRASSAKEHVPISIEI
jgi:hypothetical protein